MDGAITSSSSIAAMALERLLGVDAGGACLDQGAVARAVHELMRSSGESSRKGEQRDQGDNQPDAARDLVVELPVRMAVERVAGQHGDEQAAEHGPSVQKPIAVPRPTCGEKSR